MPEARPIPLSRPAPAALPLSSGRVRFASPAGRLDANDGIPSLDLALPVLAGPDHEVLLESATVAERSGCTVFRTAEATAGFLAAGSQVPLDDATRELYGRMLEATTGLRLCRIWNYVPRINDVENGLENYRRFCRGRAVAFEERLGPGFQKHLPAGSAVGVKTGGLAVAFLATEAEPRPFENPRQVPAFEYPADYGPRPPSFSRATFVNTGTRELIFISGTASIRGHETVAPGKLDAQLSCTLENLRIIAETAGAGSSVGAADRWRRSFKVYLRHAADLPSVQSFLERHLLRPEDGATYLHADLCRADLRVEIEAVLHR